MLLEFVFVFIVPDTAPFFLFTGFVLLFKGFFLTEAEMKKGNGEQ